MAIKRFFTVCLAVTVMLGIGTPAGSAIASGMSPRAASVAPSQVPSMALPMAVKVVSKRVKTWEMPVDSNVAFYRGRLSTVTVKGTKVTGRIDLNPDDPIRFSGKRHLGKKKITIITSDGNGIVVITFASARSRKAIKVTETID